MRPPDRYVGVAEVTAFVAKGVVVPDNYSEAINSPQKHHWIKAIEEELNNMDSLGVWVPGASRQESIRFSLAVQNQKTQSI